LLRGWGNFLIVDGALLRDNTAAAAFEVIFLAEE